MPRVCITTFNCARAYIDAERLAHDVQSTFSSPEESPDVLVFALQEVAPIPYAFLGGLWIASYLARIHDVVTILGSKYVHQVTRNVGMTALMVFAAEDALAGRGGHHDIAIAGTGLGVWGMGNKGAVGARLKLSEGSGVTFIGAHLAPMEWNLDRRNADWEGIVRRLIFYPSQNSERQNGEESVPLLGNDPELQQQTQLYGSSTVFVAGDLNYRTSAIAPTPESLAKLQAPASDASASSEWWKPLLGGDQLSRERQGGKTCHGFHEGDITFPPTYKYASSAQRAVEKEAGQNTRIQGNVKSYAHHRYPSWCDRVLYRHNPNQVLSLEKYTSLPLQPSSDHQPVLAVYNVEANSSATEEDHFTPPFPPDPNWWWHRSGARVLEVIVGSVGVLVATPMGWATLATAVVIVLGVLGASR